MAAAAPHSPPTNHRPAAAARDFCLGSDGARTAYACLDSKGGLPPRPRSSPPSRGRRGRSTRKQWRAASAPARARWGRRSVAVLRPRRPRALPSR